MTLKASIAIPTWQRCTILNRLLLALEGQTVSHDQYEIIVCDSDSNDGTEDMINTLMHTYGNIKYFNVAVNSPIVKRNEAIRRSSAPIIILLDDDVLPMQNFIEAHLNAHATHSNSVFCGQVRFPPEFVATSNYFRYRDSRYLGSSRPEINSHDMPYYLIVTMNLSFKRDELKPIGGFSEDFQYYGGEDHEFGYRIFKAGIKLIFLEQALVYHYEAHGSISQYIRKLYIAARYSGPVLYRLVPDSLDLPNYRYLEAISSTDTFMIKIYKLLFTIATNRLFSFIVKAFLDITDHIRWLYTPLLFSYIAAAAYAHGVKDRTLHNVTSDSLLLNKYFE
jgi:GT2 family glycosyltransferase